MSTGSSSASDLLMFFPDVGLTMVVGLSAGMLVGLEAGMRAGARSCELDITPSEEGGYCIAFAIPCWF